MSACTLPGAYGEGLIPVPGWKRPERKIGSSAITRWGFTVRARAIPFSLCLVRRRTHEDNGWHAYRSDQRSLTDCLPDLCPLLCTHIRMDQERLLLISSETLHTGIQAFPPGPGKSSAYPYGWDASHPGRYGRSLFPGTRSRRNPGSEDG